MKCLVTGYNGQLGYDVVKELENKNIECLGIDKNELDLTWKYWFFPIITSIFPFFKCFLIKKKKSPPF